MMPKKKDGKRTSPGVFSVFFPFYINSNPTGQ